MAASMTGASAYDDSYQSSNEETMEKDGQYWENQKIEKQKKSTEMRNKLYAELKAKGYDVSSLSSDLLDAAKTDESAFWEAVKAIKEKAQAAQKAEWEKKKAQEKAEWEKKQEEKKSEWEKKQSEQKAEYEKKQAEKKAEYEKKELERKKNVPVQKDALSPKLRKSLETQLRAIPEEKKAEFYERAKTNLTALIEKAKNAGNSKLVAKLEAVLKIVEDIVAPVSSEDSEILDALFK